jgi:hypothetical protein
VSEQRFYLRPELIIRLRKDDWPDNNDLRRQAGVAKQAVSDMRIGKPVPERLCRALCSHLVKVAAPDWKGNRSIVERVDDHLTGRGFPRLVRHSEESLFEAIFEPVMRERNWLVEGFSVVGDILRFQPLFDSFVQRCNSADSIEEATRWVFAAVGADLAKGTQKLSIEQMIALGERYMCISTATYAEALRKWLTFHPWTAVLARGKQVPTGISAIVPLTEQAYSKIRSGQIMPTDCVESDLQFPSRYLFGDTMAQRPRELDGESQTASTKSLFVCVLTQIAVLSQFHKLGNGEAVKVLSFSVTTENTRSLESNGWQFTGTKMKSCDLRIYEKTIPKSGQTWTERGLSMLLNHFSLTFQDAPPKV